MPEIEDQDPNKRGGLKNNPYSKEIREFFQRHRIQRTLINSTLKLLFYTSLFVTPSGLQSLGDPLKRRFIWDRERRTGLLENSIINPDLYHPNNEGKSLEMNSAAAGRWVGYDFNRPKEFGFKEGSGRQKFRGRLFLFDLDEVKNNSADTYTPTELFNIFNICHMLTFDSPPLEEFVEQGYLRETTYGEAYSNVGLYSKYRFSLVNSGKVDQQIYTVTPKGNTLVYLMSDGGKKVEKPKEVPEFKPVLAT